MSKNKFEAVEDAVTAGECIEIQRGTVGPIMMTLQNGDIHEFTAVELIELHERIPDLEIPPAPKLG